MLTYLPELWQQAKREIARLSRLMDGDEGVGIHAARGNVAHQDQHQKPELRPLVSALRFQGHDRAAGKIRRRRAVFGGQITCKTV